MPQNHASLKLRPACALASAGSATIEAAIVRARIVLIRLLDKERAQPHLGRVVFSQSDETPCPPVTESRFVHSKPPNDWLKTIRSRSAAKAGRMRRPFLKDGFSAFWVGEAAAGVKTRESVVRAVKPAIKRPPLQI